MLRRLKIGTRVNVLIAVPLVAMIALTLVSYVALQRASVRGDEYKQLKAAEALRSDIVPPPASLLEAWAIVNHISVLVSSPPSDYTDREIADSMRQLTETRKRHAAAVAFWRDQPMDARSRAAFEQGAQAGEAFFGKVDNLFTAAMIVRDPAVVGNAVRSLEDDYRTEQVFIGESLKLVDQRVAEKEDSVNLFVTKVVLLLSAAVSVLLLISLLVSFVVRRSIVEPIVALTKQARDVATTHLPEAVHQIQSLPADAPLPIIEPFEVRTHDELAELSASFNSVQNSALGLAAEQAEARRTVSENLVNIARRTQNLLGRSLTSLSDLEQTERDPEMLESLFKLDHLTTRMRRNAQSLLVLAGAEQNRMRSAPVPIGDVVRAAVSEIENYGRVDLADMGSILVQGALAPDVAHLLAELLENATSFSPPSTRVNVFGRPFPGGHQLAIVDYGIGMSPTELASANDTLRQHADFDKISGRMLGFQVVARLATRLGMQVSLTSTAGMTGVTAVINLPTTIFEVNASDPLAAGAAVADRSTLPPPTVDQRGLVMPAPNAPTIAAAAPVLAASNGEAVSNEEILRVMGSANDAVAAASGPPAPPGGVESVAAGLTKRVRGAQLPDLGSTVEEQTTWERPAEQVRSALSSLQRGTDLGRQQAES